MFVMTASEASEHKQARDTLQSVYGITWAQAELWLETGEKVSSAEEAREALRSYRSTVWEQDEEDRWEGVLQEVYGDA
jgi:hypothetical protein